MYSKQHHKIHSVEDLKQGVEVTRAPIWIGLLGLGILLISLAVWACSKTLDITLETKVFVQDGTAFCLISDGDCAQISLGDGLLVESKSGVVSAIADRPLSYGNALHLLGQDAYAAHRMALSTGEYYIPVYVTIPHLEDGIHDAILITDTIRPISYVFN